MDVVKRIDIVGIKVYFWFFIDLSIEFVDDVIVVNFMNVSLMSMMFIEEIFVIVEEVKMFYEGVECDYYDV